MEEKPKLKKSIKIAEVIEGENVNNLYMQANFNEIIDDFPEIHFEVSTKGSASGDESSSGFDMRIASNIDNTVLAYCLGIIKADSKEFEKKTFKLKRLDLHYWKFNSFMTNDNHLELVVRTEGEGSEIHVKNGIIKLK